MLTTHQAMIEPIDERTGVAQQVVAHLCLQIGRGVYRPGDKLPRIDVLGQQMLINPRWIAAAYERLAAHAVLRTMDTGRGRFVVDPGAPQRVRQWLLQRYRGQLSQMIGRLDKAGCTREQIEAMVNDALRTFNASDDSGDGNG